ncbi:MAG TPA: M23 family metallopeptidase, partial [Beijerinckiaceae bacterium]|nr:M23 family metallopeptidase [Beijerinckiaceae bacterium]
IDRRSLPLLIEQAQASAHIMTNNQIALLRDIEASAQSASRQMKSALDLTGLDLTRFGKALNRQPAPAAAVGGPLIPLTKSESAEFERRLASAENQLRESERLSRVVRALPVRRPLPRHHETTSTFGTRTDPFTRGLAMHSGLDFRATTGTPVRVTAEGKVVEAGWVGGYGKMVEIDHGFGLTTRYGHLSGIDVAVGDTVRKGEIVGQVGSTGRSTGPHLHYEVRIDDEAVDPQTLLRAGERAAIQ